MNDTLSKEEKISGIIITIIIIRSDNSREG